MTSFEPPRPKLVALGLFVLWIAILSLPMWSGQFLAGPWSDQYATGYAWRLWQAEQWKSLGHIPLWNPDIFGGLPYVASGHGDILYPTAWLRLVLPTALAMNLGFVIHYVLAGFFTYLLLRRLKVSWAGSVIGGLSYQLSGVIGSYVHPGHDGKLFVTALLPLALLALILALRERRFEGYALLALTVGLALLSPQFQMAYYMLIAAGLFALYLTFGEQSDRPYRERFSGLALALGAVFLGFGVAMIQVLPFFHYIPFSPRAETYRGFEGATSYAIPWEHVPEFFLSGFVGHNGSGSYWGSNPIKLHSEYLGLPVVALAILGAAGARRRLALWLGGIGLLFLLVSLGATTPFYRVWYEVMPYVKQTRAPGMALYVVALVVSVLAALGVDRLMRGEGRSHVKAWLAVGGVLALLALMGVFGGMASYLAQGIEQSVGRPVAGVAAEAQSSIRWGAFGSAASLALVAALALAAFTGRAKAPAVCFGLALLVSADLWRNARGFWTFTNAHRELHGPDQVTELISDTPKPYRVLNLSDVLGGAAYRGSSLMTHDIPQLLGHHANELHRFDELMGGKNEWRNLFNRNIWDLFAIEYVISPTGVQGADSIPGYTRVLLNQSTSVGIPANLFRRAEPARYGRLVPAAVKASDEEALATVPDPRFSPDQVVLIDSAAPINPAPLAALPSPLANRVSFEEWEPGRMEIRIEPPAGQDAYLLVGENWYPDWTATVDGAAAPVVRGNVSLITVPVPSGARRVELSFESADYGLGRTVTSASLMLVLLGFVVPSVLRRRSRA